MTMEEIVHGESKNVEFKETLPDKSEKYMKTIIAFANTQGGQLIVGVNDVTREVTGVDMDSVFKIMDRITNAVSDSCTPQIVPDITFQTIEGKTIVVVYVAPGANRPYYMKSRGKEGGTYIRVAGTSRQADADKIKELELEGARISWDELICVGYEVKENAIKKLCRDMNRYRNEMQQRKGNAEKLQQVTRAQLLNWNVIKKTEDGYLASNAFALLTGKHFYYSRTQCAVFAGTDRGEFIDKKEYDGPLYGQIEEAYAFVLRNIRRSAKVEGLIRREGHELPPDAIREMIINAHCHRNFLDNSCVQVALYDDRLEVTSPGGLCYGLTLEEAISGRSKQRNRIVAEVFNQMGLIEAWGTGLRNIRKAAKEYSLPEPQFIEMTGTFRVNLFRSLSPMEDRQKIGKTSAKNLKSIGETSVKARKSIGVELNATQKSIIDLLSENVQMSGTELAERIGISKRNIETNIKKLKEKGILVRHGSARAGYWEICI
ncbi:MAG: helix-turn-helix domain-containing protein [Schaedlerella sp.]|jgi:ATP-dependent DNA helicase RecG|uniref:AlbA family DNA-binding domain-containing protein n=1 Tax=Schaedlerella sp. TaxID=2676057 RepID=UPI0026184370|nr:helix-turn-helix domain-containing protein [uncultured Schaedlerella sp.]MCI8768467.1 winged helix-turn-helix transcriptional regulator [Ruminococcus sp.]